MGMHVILGAGTWRMWKAVDKVWGSWGLLIPGCWCMHAVSPGSYRAWHLRLTVMSRLFYHELVQKEGTCMFADILQQVSEIICNIQP